VLKDWLLLLIPAVALFIWYWGFWRNLDKDKSQQAKGRGGSNLLDAGFELKSSAGKRYIQQSKPKPIKKRASKKSAAKKGSAAKKSGSKRGSKRK
jgi:hypothetical protein